MSTDNSVIQVLTSSDRLASKISSDYEDLDSLHKTYKFIPDRDGVRPSPEAKEAKAEKLKELEGEWKDFVDFIYSSVFALPHIVTPDGKKTVPNRHKERMDRAAHVFQENYFPYLIKEGHHFVMWYATSEQKKSDEEITADIDEELKKITNSESDFQFGWYINPKMTVPEFFHVQVFWSSSSRSVIIS